MRRYYPAILERGPKGAFGLSFPDFPDCVAAGASQEQAIEKAEAALAWAVDSLAEDDQPLPAPSAVETIPIPPKAQFVALVMVGVQPPDPSERVNIYLPKSLLERAASHAAALGMSRSSYFGWAISTARSVNTAALAEFWKKHTPDAPAKKKRP